MRYLMDTLCMLAYRPELELSRQPAPHLSKPETAHEVVRHTLFASEASLVPGHWAGILKVRLQHQWRNSLDGALKPLLAELKKTRTVYTGTNLLLVYEFVSGSRQRQRKPSGKADRVQLSSRRRRSQHRTDPAARSRPLVGDC